MELRTRPTNAIERLKAEKDGLEVGPDIPRFAALGWERIPKDDVERLKWYGIFLRRQSEGEPGYFMMRIRIPNGMATAAQVQELGTISQKLGRGIADITTRQQVQLRWIRIEDVPEILERLRRVGLTTLQTGMDNVRNVVGCPLAGVVRTELFDASPVVRAFTERVVGNRAYTNLPRKFNVTITGCVENCTHAETQDLALVPAVREKGELVQLGFNVLVGGKMGSGGYRIASPLDAFVTREQAPEVCAAVVAVFRDHGPRESRGKARLSFLLDAWGVGRFRAAVEEYLGYRLPRAGRDARRLDHRDHLGIIPQKQDGLYAVGLCVPVGRLRAEQLLELARLSERYGAGEVRFTPSQNVILPHVPESRLGALLEEPLLRELPPDPPPVLRGLVSCTGTDYCNLALVDTKRRALALARSLQERVSRPVTVHWSGCPAGCGNHEVADIGLVGKKVRIGEEVVEAVDVYVGGSSGPRPTPALKLLEDVPCDALEPVLEALMRYGSFEEIRARLRVPVVVEGEEG
ncbi:MAG: ferredoxin--nitrite reductase [Armatimonadota bacterium]|nr:ferredoxin--nitrite reductase [Armatimonadota bacterium]MDR7443744.1 ferredoxin--nitrite reductase [Armatimonadota bacterium]MDR7571270.1 ferredoxin--nitrite reductase [Armatimonadota bacterium]MDR7613729.1 ferredoxin--nitrite reductase [Armatimonadota bacterium]